MYKIFIDDFIHEKIDNFIDGYTSGFLERFNDTGIFNEYLMNI